MTCTISHKYDKIKGAGLLYMKNVTDENLWSLYGFWYQSTIMCKSQIYIITFETTKKLPSLHNFGLTLEKLLSDLNNNTILRFYGFNDSNKEGIFRNYIFSCLSSITSDLLKPNIPEKTLNLFNYYFQAYIKTLKPGNTTEISLDRRLEEISKLLQPIFDELEQQPDLVDNITLNSDTNISYENGIFIKLAQLLYDKNSNSWIQQD